MYEESKAEIDDFIAHGFEDVAISFLTEQNSKGLLKYYYEPIRNYKVDNSKLGRSIELDGLAKGLGKNKDKLLVVECKYRKAPFSTAMLEQVKESVSVFDGFSAYDYYLFSKPWFHGRNAVDKRRQYTLDYFIRFDKINNHVKRGCRFLLAITPLFLFSFCCRFYSIIDL